MRFWCKLSIALGIPVFEAMSRISEQEFRLYLAYDAMNPIGNERGDLQAAIIAATVANSVPRKHARHYKPKDFIPKYGLSSRKQRCNFLEFEPLWATMRKT